MKSHEVNLFSEEKYLKLINLSIKLLQQFSKQTVSSFNLFFKIFNFISKTTNKIQISLKLD